MIYVNNKQVSPKKFPGGELHVELDPINLYHSCYINLFSQIENADDIMELLLVTDAIRRINPDREIHLTMPYVPYARQDRITAEGEALSIKVFADLINSQNYSKVIITDPHSDVTSALINRVIVNDATSQVVKIFNNRHLDVDNVVLIAPDAGAVKKVNKIASLYDLQVVVASKVRDTKTGKLSNPTIDFGSVSVDDVDLLIVDDIADGGYTFIQLAEMLAKCPLNYRSLNLYVTHGIFSKGVDVVKEHFDKVFVAYPFTKVDTTNLTLI